MRSSDAAEIVNIVRVTGLSPEFENQLEKMDAAVAGSLTFDGTITGNLADPTVEGRASLASLLLRGRDVGSLASDIRVSPQQTEFRNGRLAAELTAGLLHSSATIPSAGTDNISVNAQLTGVNAGNLLAALPFALPERLRDFNGKTSGTVALTGLPNQSSGEINIASEAGTVAGQAYDSLTAKAVFSGSRVNIQQGEIRVGTGAVKATGFYDMSSTAFDLDLTGTSVPLPLAARLPAC